MSDIFQEIDTCPREDYMHVIICEDGMLIPMVFVDPSDADIEWAKTAALGIEARHG